MLGLLATFTMMLLAIPARAAISFDAASSGSAGAGATCSWSHAVGSGSNRMLVVGVASESGTSTNSLVTGVTYGAQTMTRVTGSRASTLASSTYNATELFYLPAPNVGTATITVTFSPNLVNGANCGAVSLTGVKQHAPEAVAIAQGTSGSSYSLAVTTVTNGAWLVDVVNNGTGNASFTPTGTGMIERWDNNAGGQMVGAGATREVATAGTVTDTWTTGGTSRMAQSIAAFAAAPVVPEANMLAFEVETDGMVVYPGAITEAGDPPVGAVTVYVLDGTNVANLTPTFTLSADATSDPASGVPQDFTNPVLYTVTSSDNLVEKEYTVTVIPYTPGSSYIWAVTAAGTYEWKAMNWDNPGWPDGVDHLADMNINLAGSQTINLNGTITLGTLELGDAGSSYFGNTIAAGTGGSLVMDVTTGDATISRTNTNVADTISANIQLNDNLVVSDTSASDSDSGNFGLKLTGAITESGGSRSVTKSGGGSVTLSGTNSHSGGTTVGAGGWFRCSPASVGTGPFTINGSNSNQPDITSGNQPLNGNEVIINGGFRSHYGFKTGTGPVRLAAAGIQVLASVDIQGVVTALDGSNDLNALDINLGGVGGWGATQTISSDIVMRGDQVMTHDSGWGDGPWPGLISGDISDGGHGYKLTKAGNSRTVLSGVNTYTGDTVVTGGQLDLDAAGSLAIKVTDSGSNKLAGPAKMAERIAGHRHLGGDGGRLLDDRRRAFVLVADLRLELQPARLHQERHALDEGGGRQDLHLRHSDRQLSNPVAYITSFKYRVWEGTIDQDAKTISLTVPDGTDLATLNPTFTLYSGSCDQTSGSPPDPTFAVGNPATYTVTDGAVVREYVVTVTVAPPGQILAQNFDTDPVNWTGSAFQGSGNAYWNLSSVGITPATALTGNATTYLTACNIDGWDSSRLAGLHRLHDRQRGRRFTPTSGCRSRWPGIRRRRPPTTCA